MKNKDSIKKPESTELHKGYNEKNPTEAQGAFKPDNKTGKKTATSPTVEKDKTEKANK